MLLNIIQDLQDPETLYYDWDYPDGFQTHYLVKDTLEKRIHVDTLDHEPTFAYRYKVNTPLEEIRFLPSGITHGIDGYIVRELTARCNYDIGKLRSAEIELKRRLKHDLLPAQENYTYLEKMWHKHQCLSIEGVEFVSWQSTHLLSNEYCSALLKLVQATLKKPSFEVVTIHDCFKCLPNYMNHVRHIYIDILAELADSNILNAILSDIAGKPINISKMSENLSELIRSSEYAIS